MNAMFKALKCPIALLLAVGLISLFALIAALASEAFLGLEPCILCIYQRWPYVAVIVFGIVGLAFKRRTPIPQVMIGLSGLAFLINSGIALYHTGVEQKWWVSTVDGCLIPGFGDEPQSILENILSAPTARCDEIPWQDPLLGLSMANYNAVLCFGLFIVCAVSIYLLRHTQKAESSHNA